MGNALLIRERTRDVWGWRWLDDLGRDLRHAVRGLGRTPGFAAAVVVILAVGTGVATAMFGIVYGLLIRPLPYPDGDRIVRVGQEPRRLPGAPVYLSARALAQVQEAAESFEQLAPYGAFTFEWVSPDGARPWGAPVSPALLRLLGARPQLGRLFTDDEARTGADGVVLLSHRAWTRRFDANPDVVGTVVDVRNEPRTVVGVLAEGFYFPRPEAEVWAPYVLREDEPTAVVLGRLRRGVSPEQAAGEVGAILQGMDGAGARRLGGATGGVPGSAPDIDARVTRVIPLQEEMVGEYRPALLALAGATLLVLLIACVNVAGLLLARGVTRRRELAVRGALGAGRSRIVRQLLTESVLLGLGGGALGLATAGAVLRAVPALVPVTVTRLDEVGLDGVVLAFTLGLSVAVGLLFGAVPAFQSSGSRLLRALVEGSARSSGGFGLLRANRTRAILAAAQMALALILLVGAGLLLRSFVGLVTLDRGYDPANVVAAGTRYPLTVPPGFGTPEERIEAEVSKRRFYGELAGTMDRLSRLPGVEAVGVSSRLPLASSGSVLQQVQVDGRLAADDPRGLPQALLRVATPGYFDAMRLRLLDGRRFTRRDGTGAPRVLVVNETFARDVLGGAPAVGRRVRFLNADSDREPWEVIGVVADVTYGGLAVTGVQAEAFAPLQQIDAAPVFEHGPAMVVARTTGDPLAAVPFLREAVAEARPRRVGGDGDDDGCEAVVRRRRAPLLCGAGRRLRGPRRPARRPRGLRPAQLHRRPEAGRDRHPHGAGRAAQRRARLGRPAGHRPRGRRRRRRHRRRSRVEPRPGELRLRHRHRRPPDLRGGGARARRRGAPRLLRPGAPRDPDRADGGSALRVGSDRGCQPWHAGRLGGWRWLDELGVRGRHVLRGLSARSASSTACRSGRCRIPTRGDRARGARYGRTARDRRR